MNKIARNLVVLGISLFSISPIMTSAQSVMTDGGTIPGIGLMHVLVDFGIIPQIFLLLALTVILMMVGLTLRLMPKLLKSIRELLVSAIQFKQS